MKELNSLIYNKKNHIRNLKTRNLELVTAKKKLKK